MLKFSFSKFYMKNLEQPQMRPKSYTVTCFLVLASIYALQALPWTGIFLMIAMAVVGPLFWSLLPNALTIALISDVLRKRFRRGVLLLPALAYSSYYALLTYEYMVSASHERILATQNASLVLKFDPERNSLITAYASSIVQRFKLPVAFIPDDNFPEGYLSARMISRQLCESVRSVKREPFEFQTSGISFYDGSHFGKFQRLTQCELSNHERPARTAVVIESTKSDASVHGVTLQQELHDFIVDGKPQGKIVTAQTERLSLLPTFFFGCWLNSAAPSWDCTWGPNRSVHVLDTLAIGSADADYPVKAIAKVLALKPYSDEDYEQFQDYAETSQFVTNWLKKRLNETPADFNSWGVRKDSSYMPVLGMKNGHESYTGGIYPRKEGGEFLAFVRRNNNKIVYIDAVIGPGVNGSISGGLFSIWGVCKNSDSCARTDHSFKLKTKQVKNPSKRQLIGFWKIGKTVVAKGSDNDTTTELEQYLP